MLARPVLLIGLALAAAGCAPQRAPTPCDDPASLNLSAASRYGMLPATPQPSMSIGRMGARITESDLASVAYVDDVRAGRTPNGAGVVSLRVFNCSATPLQVEGSVQFLNGYGVESEAPTVWQRIFVPPRSSRAFEALAVNPGAASFMVDLREGR
ncbi:hypothetical protein IAI18_05890 [Acetobacteraceae bacterium H6797]|nr:hypothetical protein [Acetobacteraceae bacterium H6797]